MPIQNPLKIEVIKHPLKGVKRGGGCYVPFEYLQYLYNLELPGIYI